MATEGRGLHRANVVQVLACTTKAWDTATTTTVTTTTTITVTSKTGNEQFKAREVQRVGVGSVRVGSRLSQPKEPKVQHRHFLVESEIPAQTHNKRQQT